MSDHEITVTLKADANGCLSVIKQVTRSVDELSGKKVGNAGMPELANGAQRASQSLKQTKADTDALASAIGKIKGMIAGAFTVGAITSLGKKALEASANMEVLRQGLDFVLGSSEETDKLINGMRALGEQSAYDTNELIPLARQWVNMGDNAETAVGKMTKIVDLGSAFGLTSEQIGSATLALSQMAAAGKINGQDMLQLTNANIPAWKLLADHMGLSVAELRKMSEAGQLGEDAINELWNAIEERTKGATARMNGTLMAAFSNLQESISNSMAGIGDIISKSFNLTGILTGWGDVISKFREGLEQVKKDVSSVGIGQAILNQVSAVSPELLAVFWDLGNTARNVCDIVASGWKKICDAFADLDITAILIMVNDLLERIGPIVEAAVMVAVAALTMLVQGFVALINVVANVYNAVSPYFENIGKDIRSVIGGAIKFVTGLWEGFVQLCSHPIDFVVNKIIRGSHDAPGVMPDGYAQGGVFGSFATGGVVGGRIPALANGGQLKHGTPAVVGEAGPEAVIPLKKAVLGSIGQSIAESAKISSFVQGAVEDAVSMDANKKNPVYNTRKSFSDTTKPKDVDAYTKILDETKQKILKINEAQAKFHEEWQKAQEDAAKYTEGGEKTLAFQKQMASNQEKIAKLQEKISSGNGDAKDAEALKTLQLQTQNRIAEYEKEKAAAIAAAQETQDAITNIDAEAEAARQKVKQQAVDQMGSYETQVAEAQYAQKKAMMATELDDFLAQMTAKDEITGQSYATTLANEQYLAEQRRVWMDELMLASVSWGEYMQTMLTNMAVQVQDGIASGIAQCVVEGKKFSQVMSNLAKTLLKQLIQGVIQKVISGWIMAMGLGNNRHKQEMKNTAAETEAAAAKATVMASVATAAVIAANPAGAAGAGALVSKQMGIAAFAAGTIAKAAQAVFKGKEGGIGAGDTNSGVQETTTKSTGPAIQIGDTSLLDKLPGMATGGVVTGPTAALIGEGRYDEAVLPLKPSLLDKLFGGGDDNRQNTVVATQNIYGNINSRDDEDDLFGGFNDMVLAGLRGA
ncbi:tape measure protein [Acidaminococcus fermentans]|uniref:Tape measure protein n=2 Tax=Acidaminococcus fermentans TaxID=905 RepID=A0A6N7VZA8_ACIFE|nr:tape measure protein [Acidaminococcus fermentans]